MILLIMMKINITLLSRHPSNYFDKLYGIKTIKNFEFDKISEMEQTEEPSYQEPVALLIRQYLFLHNLINRKIIIT